MDAKMTEFILAACDVFAIQRDSERLDYVKEVVQKGIHSNYVDWNCFFECGELHRYLPAAYYNINNNLHLFDEISDETVKDRLHASYVRSLTNNDKYYSEIESLFHDFEEKNIKALLIKGELLALNYYPDRGIRSFDDCDLLMNKQDIKEAEEILRQHGYIQGYGEDGIIKKPSLKEIKFARFFMKHIIAYVKYNEEKLYVIEPHYLLWWHKPSGAPAFELSMQTLIERAQKVDLFHESAWKMNNEDLLIYLAIDLYEDAYRIEKIMQEKDLQLLKFLDVYSAIMNGVDWNQVISIVHQFNMNTSVWFTLNGLNQLYKVVPQWVLDEIKPENIECMQQFGFPEELVNSEHGRYERTLYERLFDIKYRKRELSEQESKFKETSFQCLKAENEANYNITEVK